MLGFAPLGAIPLGAAGSALIAVPLILGATGGLTFNGTGAIGARTHLTATGGITFSGSGFVTTQVYRSATGGIIFNGHPFLRVAGRPIIITALPDSFTIRATIDDYSLTALPQSYTVRGVPE